MFTGLVEGRGRVVSAFFDEARGGRLTIEDAPWEDPLHPGDSVAVNGACLTAIQTDQSAFEAELSLETLSRTNLSDLRTKSEVNLERPLRIGDRLGGHLVQGHVDGVGEMISLEEAGEGWTMEVEVPEVLRRYVVEKGSIAVDGISLTVSATSLRSFQAAVIPKTMELTNLSTRRAGDRLNLEVDIIAKYVENLLQFQTRQSAITEDFLRDHGFI